MVTRSLDALYFVFALTIRLSVDALGENSTVYFEIAGFPTRNQPLPLHCTVNTTSNYSIEIKQRDIMKVLITDLCMIQVNDTDIRASCDTRRDKTIVDILIPQFTSSHSGTWTCQHQEEKQEIRLSYSIAPSLSGIEREIVVHVNDNITTLLPFEHRIEYGFPELHSSMLDWIMTAASENYVLISKTYSDKVFLLNSTRSFFINISVHAESTSMGGPYYWGMGSIRESGSFLLTVKDFPSQPVITFDANAVDYGHAITAYCDTAVKTRPKYKADPLVHTWFLNDVSITDTDLVYSQEDEVLKIHYADCGLVDANLTCVASEGNLVSGTSDYVFVSTGFTCWLKVLNTNKTIVEEDAERRTYQFSVEVNAFPAPSFTWMRDNAGEVRGVEETKQISMYTYIAQNTVATNMQMSYTVIVRNDFDENIVRFKASSDSATASKMVSEEATLPAGSLAGVAVGIFVAGVVAVLAPLTVMKKCRSKHANKGSSKAWDERPEVQLDSISATMPPAVEDYEQLRYSTRHNRGARITLPEEPYDELQVQSTPKTGSTE